MDLMIAQETKVGELYRTFAELHPDHADFWSSMAEAERRHADMLREIRPFLSSRQVLLVEGKVRAEPIRSFLSYLDGVVRRARAGEIPFVKALSISVDIEKSMLEKGMLDRFRGASADVNDVLEKLREETAAHAAMAEEKWRQCRPSAGGSGPSS
jgi:rubrerythrin